MLDELCYHKLTYAFVVCMVVVQIGEISDEDARSVYMLRRDKRRKN